jgi:hypothetical protein
MADQGSNLVLGIIQGIGSKIASVKDKVREMANSMLDTFKSFKTNFQTAAKDVISGLVQGVKDKISSAVNAAKDIGSSMLSGLKSKLGIASPSKEMAEIGKYSDEGFAQGLLKNAKLIANAADKVGSTAKSRIADAFENIGSTFDDYFGGDPIIRPVLDLSNVSSGMNTLSSMLNIDKSIDAALQTNSSFGGTIGSQTTALLDAVNGLNARVGMIDESIFKLQRVVDGGLSESVAMGVREGLDGAAVNADGAKIGSIVTSYQRSMQRRGV